MHNRQVGKKGEKIAAEFLEKLGYKILERNFRAGRGEIDLIICNKTSLVFVEVKARMRGGYGLPEERVDLRKQRQIGRVAQLYLQTIESKLELDCRFDVVAVDLNAAEPVIRHIENAFWLEAE